MKVIGRSVLSRAQIKHPEIRNQLTAWLTNVEQQRWSNLMDLRNNYCNADGGVKGQYTVFNVMGNNYRLVTIVNYKLQTVRIYHILTQSEYTKWSKEKWLLYQ